MIYRNRWHPAVIVVAMMIVGTDGCSAPRETPTETAYAGLLQKLAKGYERTRFSTTCWISPRLFVGIEARRIWAGRYRNRDVAVYSYITERGPFAQDVLAGVVEMGLILAVEMPGKPIDEPFYDGPELPRQVVHAVGRIKVPVKDVDLRALTDVAEAMPHPFQTPIFIGRWQTKDVRYDSKKGLLVVEMDHTKPAIKCEFNLEKLLADWSLKGETVLRPDVEPKWSRDEFIEKTERSLRSLAADKVKAEGKPLAWAGDDPRYKEVVILDHSRWYDAEAIRNLLEKLSPAEMTLALNFMSCLQGSEADYLMKLTPCQGYLLQLCRHPSAAVRKASSQLLDVNRFWPKDINILDPLLQSDDTTVLRKVLLEFKKGGTQPKDLARLRALTRNQDVVVRRSAKQLLAKDWGMFGPGR